MYTCTLEEFIVVSFLYKNEVKWHGIYTGIYTNIWIDYGMTK